MPALCREEKERKTSSDRAHMMNWTKETNVPPQIRHSSFAALEYGAAAAPPALIGSSLHLPMIMLLKGCRRRPSFEHLLLEKAERKVKNGKSICPNETEGKRRAKEYVRVRVRIFVQRKKVTSGNIIGGGGSGSGGSIIIFTRA